MTIEGEDVTATRDESLEAELADIAGSEPGMLVAISSQHVELNLAAHVGGNTPMQMCSVFKIPVMVSLYGAAERGEIALDEPVSLDRADRVDPLGSGIVGDLDCASVLTVRDLIRFMIVASDNWSTDYLIMRLGGPFAVDRSMRALGIVDSPITQTCRQLLLASFGFEDANDWTTAKLLAAINDPQHRDAVKRRRRRYLAERPHYGTTADMTKLLTFLATGRAVSSQADAEMLGIMLRQLHRYGIPRLLPIDTPIANKTGLLYPIYSAVTDAALITLPDRSRVALTVYTQSRSVNTDPGTPQADALKLAQETEILRGVVSRAAEAVYRRYRDRPPASAASV
ncbi:MAG: serine hydrolase [Phenylobacterium sp.]